MRPEAPQLGRRPRQDDEDRVFGLQHQSRRGAGDPDHHGARRERRLLADALGEVRIGTPQALRNAARDGLDLGLERATDGQLTAGRARQELDRAIVVRRPEAARDRAEIGAEPLTQRRLELGRIIPDDLDTRRLEPEPQQLAGQERPVQVGPLAAHELAAGDDYDPARAGQAVAGATETPRAVTSTITDRPLPGSGTGLPLTAALTLPGLPKLIQSRRATKRWD